MRICQVICDYFSSFFQQDRDLQKAVRDAAQNLTTEYIHSKRSDNYFKRLHDLLGIIQKLEASRNYKKLEDLSLPTIVSEDVRLVRDIKYFATKQFAAPLKRDVQEAINLGIPAPIIQDFIGDSFDIECMSEKAAEKKLKEYLNKKDQDCPICLVSFSVRDFVNKAIYRTACSHFFHKRCYKSLIEKKFKTCAMCRSDLGLQSNAVKCWDSYLNKIHTQVLENFSKKEVQLAKRVRKVAKETENDEAVARRLQAEFNQEREDEIEQIRSDALLAASLI